MKRPQKTVQKAQMPARALKRHRPEVCTLRTGESVQKAQMPARALKPGQAAWGKWPKHGVQKAQMPARALKLVLLGMAADGIPIAGRLWQQWQRRFNHLLVYGGSEYVLSLLLEPVLYSMVFQAAPYGSERKGYSEPMGARVWQYFIITPRPAGWHPLVAQSALCQGIASPDPDRVERAFALLVEEVSQREAPGPTHEGDYWPWRFAVLTLRGLPACSRRKPPPPRSGICSARGCWRQR